ncbi:hypothetical protein E0Z10_g10393 [Xylaria hypoxylon]|uniref:Uncharacterized protein n=1 Tax=Xylaria hypoxylon TaxID=37992 RepID=A0A4Z0Y3P5_9PEZI|nr:hypothetical protein E0Z10_g10393 [Xylaria hypoxylon]
MQSSTAFVLFVFTVIAIVVKIKSEMTTLRLAVKAIITWLMIQMVYVAGAGVFAMGMLLCSVFGNDSRRCQPSVDLLLFFGTAVVSKHMESLPRPHEFMFDAHILSLATLYFVAGDKFRASLLGVWLPYFYMDSDRCKCGLYTSLVVIVSMFPYLRRAYQVVWPPTSVMLYDSMRMTFSKLCIYTIKAIESVTPPPLTLSHPPPPSPSPPPMLSLFAIITTANIAPVEELKAAMVDSSTQTESHTKANSSTQWEEDWAIKPSYSPKKTTRYIVTGNGIFSAPPDLPPMKRVEPSRIRKQRLRDLSRTKFPAPPLSPRAWPVKSVMFTPISASASPAPAPAPESPASPSLSAVDPTPLSPSPAPVLTAQSAPISTPASPIVAAEPALSFSTGSSSPSLVTHSLSGALSSASLPGVPCLGSVPVHSLPAVTALPSPSSVPVLFQASPVHVTSSIPVLVPTPAILSSLLPSPPILPTIAFQPAPVCEFEPESNPEPDSLSFSPVLPPTLNMGVNMLVGSCSDAPIVAPADPMEVDRESVSVVLPVDDTDDIDMGEAIREEVQPEFDLSQCLDNNDIESDVGSDFENAFTEEDVISNELASTNDGPPLEFNSLAVDQEMDNSLYTAAGPQVPDFPASSVDEQMHDAASAVAAPPAVENSCDDMMVDENNRMDENCSVFDSSASGPGLVGASALAAVFTAVPASPAVPSTFVSAVPASRSVAMTSPVMSPAPTIPFTPVRPVLKPVPTSNRLPPRPPNANPPVAFNMTPSPSAPKLNPRFIMSDVPKRLECNILALQPGYRPARKTNVEPRTKAVYVEEFEDNDGYRQKVLWYTRGSPSLNEEALLQLEQRMNEAAEEASKDWPSRKAGIEEQTRLDFAAKKARDKEKLVAKHNAQLAAYERCQGKKKKKKNTGPSVFIQRKKRP